MADSIKGTFSGTGISDVMAIARGQLISMDFAGTATVAIQKRMAENGAWSTVLQVTSTFHEKWDHGGDVIRLNCTAHTNNVVYEIV